MWRDRPLRMKKGRCALTNRKRVPLPGQRILRSVIAIVLCFGIYFLRGRQGMPFFSVIAAMQCITPYTSGMYKVAYKRVLGTAIGALWGLAALLLEKNFLLENLPGELNYYLMLSVLTGLVLYSTVLMKVPETAYFSAVVFLSIAMNHIGDEAPLLYALTRLMDTVVGVLVAEFVNRLHLPRVRNTDTLFVSAIGETILGPDRQLSPYSRIELNRLIQDGAKFTVATGETQASVRELLPGVDLRYPIITMNGATLYSIPEMRYLGVVTMSEEASARFITWAEARGTPLFSNCVEENLLVVRYREVKNEGMRLLMDTKLRSPYRNYVLSQVPDGTRVLYFLVLDTPENLDSLERDLAAEPWSGEYRVQRDRLTDYPGYERVKVYDRRVSRQAMLSVLEEQMGTRKTVTMGSVPGQYDVYIADADRDQVVKELKRRFEPVSLRGWRNIFRWK